jgi:hypothetical protein
MTTLADMIAAAIEKAPVGECVVLTIPAKLFDENRRASPPPAAPEGEPDDCYERIPRGALTVKIVEVKDLREDIDKLLAAVRSAQSVAVSATNDVAREKFAAAVDALPRWLKERLGASSRASEVEPGSPAPPPPHPRCRRTGEREMSDPNFVPTGFRLWGWFDDASQKDKASYEPPHDAPCPYCFAPITADDMRTHSLMWAEGYANRSYFYRSHRTCDDAAKARGKSADGKILDAIAKVGD